MASKFKPGDSVLWAEHAKSSAKKVRAKVISEVYETVGLMYSIAVEGSEVPQQAFEDELEAVGGHVHYIMATVIPTSLLTLESAIKRQLKIAAEACSATPDSEMYKLCEAVDTMYAELHEALDMKPIMPGFPEFIMPSMVRDLGHNLPTMYKGHRHQRPPVVSESVKRYLAYWAQKKAPKFNLYRCTYCNKQLKTIRPLKGETFTTLALCPYCEGAYHLTVTELRVEVKTNGNKHPD